MMASPVKEAKTYHQGRGFTQVEERGRGSLTSRNPVTGEFAHTNQMGGAGWHFGAGPFTVANEVDTAWQSTTGAWQYEMTLADYNVFARDTFNVGDIFEFRHPASGEWVRFDPQSLNWVNQDNSRQQIAIKQNVGAVVTDDVLRFPAGWGAGRHFEYRADTAKLLKKITIDAPANLPAPTVAGPSIWLETEFTLSTSAGVGIYLDGVKWAKANNVRVKTANRIEFRDEATGQQLFWVLDFPRAWDSAGNETIGEFEVRRQGGTSSLFITVRIPRAWVDAATYPIYIDPTVDVQVGASGNDYIWNETLTNFSDSGTQLIIGLTPGSERINSGARFTGVTVSGTVSTAYIDVKCNLSLSSTCLIKIRAVDADNPNAPNNYSQAESSSKTTAEVNHSAASWTSGSWYLGTNDQAEIKTVIQELVDSYTISGDAVIITLEDNANASASDVRTVHSYDSASADAPKLHIEYSTGRTTRNTRPVWLGVGPAVTHGISNRSKA